MNDIMKKIIRESDCLLCGIHNLLNLHKSCPIIQLDKCIEDLNILNFRCKLNDHISETDKFLQCCSLIIFIYIIFINKFLFSGY